MTAEECRRTIDLLRLAASDAGIVLDYNAIVCREVFKRHFRVTWSCDTELQVLFDTPNYSAAAYLAVVRSRCYSLLLRDAGVVQFTYEFHSGRLTSHRLLYMRCPVVLDPDELSTAAEMGIPVADLIEDAIEGCAPDRIAASGWVRFDYARTGEGPSHPASHLHIATSSCRMPMVAPVSPRTFMRFIVQHYYPFSGAPGLVSAVSEGLFAGRCMVETQEVEPHLNWRRS